MKLSNTFFIVISISLFTSCIGVKTASSSGKISKHIEEFFVGDGVSQYFIKPLEYIGTKEEQATLDATIRNKNKETDSLTVNFSIILNSDSKINKVTLNNTIDDEFVINSVNTLFRERTEENSYTHRASIKLPYKVYLKYLLADNHTITSYNTKEEYKITPSKAAKKTIAILKEKLPYKMLN